MDSTADWGFGLFLLIVIAIIINFIPFIIANKRGHHYKWIILVLCLVPIGFTWLIAFIWAVWPQNKSLADPIAGNVTGLGNRNVGDTVGSARAGDERGYAEEKATFKISSNTEEPQTNQKLFQGEMTLDNDGYKIFLVKKYSIEKNVALDKFIVGERLFNSIEEALSYASGIDERSTPSQSQNISTQNIDTQKKIDEIDNVDSYAKSNLAKVSTNSEAIKPNNEPRSASSLTAKKDEEKKSETNLIRNRLIIGSVLLLVGGAYYINKTSEDPKITALIKKSNTAVFECNEKNIKSSCNVAKQTIKELKSNGYCRGRVNEPRSNYDWHKCDKNSL
jgi:hypothetical protein